MNAPTWLPTLFSILMIGIACYALWRILIAQGWGRTIDYETDGLHVLAGTAAAGVVSTWAGTLPRPVWTVLFAAAGIYFAARAATAWAAADERRRLLGGCGCCAVLVYVFIAGIAPSTLNGSTAGQYTMAGMPGMIRDQTERYPALGLLLLVGLVFAAVATVDRVGSMPSLKPMPSPVVGGPNDGAPIPLAPRSVLLCRVLLLLVLAYAILSKLV